MQQQVGSIDCGLFAIAFAVEIASNGLGAAFRAKFEQQEMRTHLHNCFQRKTLEPKVADNEESITSISFTSFDLSK